MSYKVLLVEDSPSDAELFQEMLAGNPNNQCQVEVVERLSSAIERLQETSFDLTLLDLSLPDSHGLETFTRLQSSIPNVPVMVLTGLNDEVTGSRAVSLGAQDYLVKNSTTSDLLVKASRYAIERHRIQNELRVKEKTLSTLVNDIPDMIMRFDRHLFLRLLNPAADKVLQMKQEDLLNKVIDDLPLPAETLVHWKKTLEEVLNTGFGKEIEFTLVNSLGSRFYRAWVVPEGNVDGLITEVLFTARDLTEYKQSQEALAESQASYRDLFENAQDIIFTLNTSGEVTSINQAAEILLGYSRDEMLGHNFYHLVNILHIEQTTIAEHWDQLTKPSTAQDSQLTSEIVLLNKNNEHVVLEVNSRTIYRDGKVVGTQGIARDIRDRKQAEETLRKSEADFRLLAENSTDMISRHTPNGVYLYASPACYTLLGYEADELVGQPAYEFFHPDDLEAIRRAHSTILRHSDIQTVTYRIRKKSSEYTWFETTSHAICDPKTKQVIEIQSTSRDISERKQAEMEVRHAQAFAQNTVDSLGDHLAIVDAYGVIISTNKVWDEYALANGATLEAVGPGVNYFSICEIEDTPEEVRIALSFGSGLRAVLDGTMSSFSQEYALTSSTDSPWFLGRITPFKGSGNAKAVISHENITERKQMEEAVRQHTRREKLFNDIAIAANAADDVQYALQFAIDHICAFFQFEVGHAYVRGVDDKDFISAHLWHLDNPVQFEPFHLATEALNLSKPGETFLRSVIKTPDISWIKDIRVESQFIRSKTAHDCGLVSALALPVMVRQEVAAILEFFSTQVINVDIALQDYFKSIGTQLGRSFERKQAENQLKHSEERFRALLQNSADIVSVFDIHGVALFHSDAIEKLMGYPIAQIVGRTLFHVFHPDDLSLIREILAKLISQPTSSELIEARVRHADGSWRWLEAVISNQMQNPVIKGFIVNSRDVTERKIAEEITHDLYEKVEQRNFQLIALHETGRALSSSLALRDLYWTLYNSIASMILEASHFVIALFNADRLEVNFEFAIVDGQELRPEEIPLIQFYVEPVKDALDSHEIQLVEFDQADLTPKIRNQGLQIVDAETKSGIYIPMVSNDTVRGVIVIQSHKTLTAIDINLSLISTIATQAAVSIENATLYKETQDYASRLEERVAQRTKQLAILNERMAAILNNTTDSILLITEAGKIEIANPAFNNLFGYEIDELFNQPLTCITDMAHRSNLLASMRNVLEEMPSERLQIICMRKDKSTFEAEISLARVPNNENHLVCTVFDISRFKAVERLKDQFISTVNHEIRTPLTAIISSAETVTAFYDRLSDEQRLRKVTQIQKQAQVMNELIDAILDIGRIEAKQQRQTLVEIDMVQVVQQVVDELEPMAEKKSQTLSLALRIDSATIMGDQTDFSRIWRNLISNAIKYTSDTGSIEVSLTTSSRREPRPALPNDAEDRLYLVGQVQDTGHGIAPEDMQHLFTRFYRGWAKQSQIPGTGLGLSLVRELVTFYGGDISVISQVGQGTTFTFWLPISQFQPDI